MKYVAYRLNTYKFVSLDEGFQAVNEYGDIPKESIAWVSADKMAELLVNGNAMLIEPKFKQKEYWPKVWVYQIQNVQNKVYGFFYQHDANSEVTFYILEGENKIPYWSLSKTDNKPYAYNISHYPSYKLLPLEDGLKLIKQVSASQVII